MIERFDIAGYCRISVGEEQDRDRSGYTLETARNSTGLGLAISKNLVERMGGTVEVRYEGERLEIRICFPER